MRSIYLDYNATTPLDPGVREAMLPFLGAIWGNPSSVHHVGRHARARLDDARDRLASIWKARPSEVVFTSGGTESNNLAIFGTARLLRNKGRHLITSPIEHHAVLHCFQYLARREGFEITYLPVGSDGIVNPADLARAFRPDTVFVSVMAANNETGAIQPVAELGCLCRERGVVFHTDAVQWFGKLPFDSIHQFNADLVSVCAHKFFGPKGAGALFIQSPLLPDPILFGGGHENERRAGTENLAAIIGLVEAFSRFVPTPTFKAGEAEHFLALLERTVRGVSGASVRSPTRQESRLLNTLAFTVRSTDSTALLAGLDLEGVCASSGSACSAGSLEASHVMLAMGVPAEEANALVRFSLGPDTSREEIAIVEQVVPKVVARIQANNKR